MPDIVELKKTLASVIRMVDLTAELAAEAGTLKPDELSALQSAISDTKKRIGKAEAAQLCFADAIERQRRSQIDLNDPYSPAQQERKQHLAAEVERTGQAAITANRELVSAFERLHVVFAPIRASQGGAK